MICLAEVIALKLNSIFCDNMVFAANKPIRVYGQGEGEITVAFNGKTTTVKAKSGKWLAEFEPMNYGGPYILEVSQEQEKIVLNNVYIGEVYLCSGQSNMQFKLGESTYPKEEYASNKNLRLFSTERMLDNEHFKPKDGWVICEKETAEHWSALGYHIGQQIVKKRGVAVGIIACYQGASCIESWVPKGELEKRNACVKKELRHPDHYWVNFQKFNGDGALYEFALSQVIPFSVSSVIWYQGESDAKIEEARIYDKELAELIKIWRNAFCDNTLPFVVVQIADFINARYKDGWEEVQNAQKRVINLVNNVTVVESKDLCENNDIHPPTKHLLGLRIAEELLKQ